MGYEEKIMKNYDTTVIVPMRSGSKGIKNKNIKEFLGIPLFVWTLKKLTDLLQSKKINKVIISTDNDWYLDKIRLSFPGFKNELILSKRSEDLSQDFTTTEEVCLAELNKYNIVNGILSIIEVTSPLIPVEMIDVMINSIDDFIDSSFLVYKDIGQFWKCNKPDYKWNKLYSNRKMRQIDEESLYREVGAWTIKVERFLQEKNRIVELFQPIIIGKEFGISINTEDDFYYAEYLMKEYSPQVYKNTGYYDPYGTSGIIE